MLSTPFGSMNVFIIFTYEFILQREKERHKTGLSLRRSMLWRKIQWKFSENFQKNKWKLLSFQPEFNLSVTNSITLALSPSLSFSLFLFVSFRLCWHSDNMKNHSNERLYRDSTQWRQNNVIFIEAIWWRSAFRSLQIKYLKRVKI